MELGKFSFWWRLELCDVQYADRMASRRVALLACERATDVHDYIAVEIKSNIPDPV